MHVDAHVDTADAGAAGVEVVEPCLVAAYGAGLAPLMLTGLEGCSGPGSLPARTVQMALRSVLTGEERG